MTVRRALRQLHLALVVAWVAMIPVALATGWIKSLVFISACSIYANAAAHWSAYEGARAEEEARD